MKKIISFLILFIPWILSLIIILNNNFNIITITYTIISLLFYLLFSIQLYKKIKLNNYDNDFILNLCLFYIINQSFNICLFYYKFIILSIMLFISIIIILYNLKNT